MSVFQTKALAIADRLITVENLDRQTVSSGPFIQFLMQLLQQLLPALLACIPIPPAGGSVTPAQVLAAMKKLNRIQQWMLRYKVYQAVNDPANGDYLGAPIIRQIGWMMVGCTEAEVGEAMQEVGNNS